MTLQGMEEEVAVNVLELVKTQNLTSFAEVAAHLSTSHERIEQWLTLFEK